MRTKSDRSTPPRASFFRSFAVLLLTAFLAGCATIPESPETELPSSDPDWSMARPAAEVRGRSELSGLSDRSRDIERNLGVR